MGIYTRSRSESEQTTMKNCLGAMLALLGSFFWEVGFTQPVPVSDFTQVSVGWYHSCGISTSGGVSCWGRNSSGQLGNGGTTDSLMPSPVIGLPAGVVKVLAGPYTSCALTESGVVYCWGDNSFGQFGNGNMVGQLIPVAITTFPDEIADVSIGLYHSCAVTQTGATFCWGYNSQGQLGNGSTTRSFVPTPVTGLSSGVESISVGRTHSCAVLVSGAVNCWGKNYYGQLGNASSNNSSNPVQVAGLSLGVRRVVTGEQHSCALMDSNAVKCWGFNYYGQSGHSTYLLSTTPVDVTGLSEGVIDLSSGDNHTCAVLANNSLKCWGLNRSGQIANGYFAYTFEPFPIGLVSGSVLSVSAGLLHNCALLSSGEVHCWGNNYYGQLGDNRLSLHLQPVEVANIENGIQVIEAAMGNHSCAITSAGGVQCWGKNEYGQLGDGTTENRTAPTNVVGLNDRVTKIALGIYHSCAITEAQALFCWGKNEFGQLGLGIQTYRILTPTAVTSLGSGVISVGVGALHTCAVTDTNDAFCWGYLYTGTFRNAVTTPRLVSDLENNVKSISVGADFTCAVSLTDNVFCWGDNSYGSVGDGTNINRSRPAAVIGLSGSGIKLRSGGTHSCALNSIGEMRCWGDNYYGQLGDGSSRTESTTPVQVLNLPADVKDFSLGGAHNLLSTHSGQVFGWGNGLHGQFGMGGRTEQLLPIALPFPQGSLTAITAGGAHSCALQAQGVPICWGSDSFGQIGNGGSGNSTPRPVVSGGIHYLFADGFEWLE